MTRLTFTIQIAAAKSKVWQVLWDDTTYRQWTSVFSEGSYAVTDWKEGSQVLFLSGEGEGMYSTIAKNIPEQFMSIRHMGVLKNGIAESIDEETKKWSGAMENYILAEMDGLTELTVELDMIEEHQEYFREVFPKALEKVKAIAEK